LIRDRAGVSWVRTLITTQLHTQCGKVAVILSVSQSMSGISRWSLASLVPREAFLVCHPPTPRALYGVMPLLGVLPELLGLLPPSAPGRGPDPAEPRTRGAVTSGPR
jgi:hypothetical protein